MITLVKKNLSLLKIIFWLCIVFVPIHTNTYASPDIEIYLAEGQVFIDENTETDYLPIIISHSNGGKVTLTCESSNLTLVSESSFLFTPTNSHFLTTELMPPPSLPSFIQLKIIPNRNQWGQAKIDLCLTDENHQRDTVSFGFVVNGRPVISSIPDQHIGKIHHIDFQVQDPETVNQELDWTILISPSHILPKENIALTFLNNRPDVRMTIIPIEGQNGVVDMTLQVSDHRIMTQETFQVTIESIQMIHLPNHWTIPQNSDSIPIPLSICSSDSGRLTLSIQSTDETIVPNTNILFDSLPADAINLSLVSDSCQSYTFLIQPAENSIGVVDIRVTVDDGLLVESKEMQLTVVNHSPQITDIPSQVIKMNTSSAPIAFTVSDAEGGWITLACYSDNVMASTACGPEPGITRFWLNPNETKFFSQNLSPQIDFLGNIAFSITLTDGFSFSSTEFSITVNYPPTFLQTETAVININSTASPVPLSIIDQDTPLDNLTFSLDIPCSNLFSSNNIDFQCHSGCSLLLTPTTNQSGTCDITVHVNDGFESNSAKISIRVNKNPFLGDIAPQETKEDEVLQVTSQALDDDPLTRHQWSFEYSDPSLVDTADIQLDPDHQSVHFNFSPAADMFGQTTVTVIMTDPYLLSDSHSFLWQIQSVEDLSAISGLLSGYTIEENTDLTLTISLCDPDTPLTQLDLTATSHNIGIISNDNIDIQGKGESRTIHIIPTRDQFGEAKIMFKLFNRDYPDTFQEFPVNITVYQENNPPIIVSSHEFQLHEDDTYLYRIKGGDSDGHELVYKIEQYPDFGRIMHFNETTGLFTYVPRENFFGVDHMTVSAFDGFEYSDPASLTITILSRNDTPIARDSQYIILKNQILSIDLHAFDIDTNDALVYRLTNTTKTRGEVYLSDFDNGIAEYTPPLNETGEDQVWFFVKDTSGIASNFATVRIFIEAEMRPEFLLTVNLGGQYSPPDTYDYAFLDATDNSEILSGTADTAQFAEHLYEGSYRLIIIAPGYTPYEYSHNNDPIIRLDKQAAITCNINENTNFQPVKPSVQVSKTSIHNGFILRVVKKNFTDQFVMKINNQTINTGEETWPYLYKWTVPSSPFTVSSTVQPYTVDKYTIKFDFFHWEDPVDTYEVTFYDLNDDNSKKHYRSDHRVAFEKSYGVGGAYGSTALYETEGYGYFYPLMGNSIDIRIQAGTGTYTETVIDIPRIPLKYLIVDDSDNWEYNEDSDYYDLYDDQFIQVMPSDRLKATYCHYAFFMTIASGIAIEFEMADGPNAGKKVRFNPFHYDGLNEKYIRLSDAPTIRVPLLLNSNYNRFHEFSEALLDLMNTFPALLDEKGDGSFFESKDGYSDKFHRVDMPFELEQKMIVYLKSNHLTRFAALWSTPVEADDDVGHQYFHAESIDDGGCFIQGLLFCPHQKQADKCQTGSH